jgi:hypothetical protein
MHTGPRRKHHLDLQLSLRALWLSKALPLSLNKLKINFISYFLLIDERGLQSICYLGINVAVYISMSKNELAAKIGTTQLATALVNCPTLRQIGHATVIAGTYLETIFS